MAKGLDVDEKEVEHDKDEEEQNVGHLLPTGKISWSQLTLYFSCPKRYEFRYVKRASGRKTSYMAQGGLVHAVAEEMCKAWMESKFKKLPSAELMNDTVSTKIKEATEAISVWEKNHADMANPEPFFEEETRALCERYRVDRIPTLRPRVLEAKVTGFINGVIPMVGYIDVIDRDLEAEKAFGIPESDKIQPTDVVRDTKVTAKKYNPIQVCNSLQLSSYCLLTETRKVGYDLVVRRTKRLPERLFMLPEDSDGVAVRTEGELKWAADVIQDTTKSIISGNFPRCDPESWACNPNYCDYFDQCRGQYGPLTFYSTP